MSPSTPRGGRVPTGDHERARLAGRAVALAAAGLAWLSLAHSAHAQGADAPVLRYAAVAARGMPLASDTMDGYITDEGRRARSYGWYVYAVSRGTVNGRAAYLVTSNYRGSGRNGFRVSDSLALDSASLAPLWRRMHAHADSAAITYDGRHVTGWADRENAARVGVDSRLSEHAVDRALLQWLVPAMPLTQGSRVSVPVYSMWSNTERVLTLTVTGTEVLQLGERRVESWVVRLGSSPTDTTGSRFWIAKATGRVVQTTALHQGSLEILR